MKKLNFIFAIAVFFLLGLSNGFAQKGSGGNTEEGLNKRMERLAENLSLSADQQKQIKADLQVIAEKRKALKSEQSNDRKAQRELMIETDNAIKKSLTTEQKVKYDQIKAERRESMKEKRGQNKQKRRAND